MRVDILGLIVNTAFPWASVVNSIGFVGSSSATALNVWLGTIGTKIVNEPFPATVTGPAKRVPLVKKIETLIPGLYRTTNTARVGVGVATPILVVEVNLVLVVRCSGISTKAFPAESVVNEIGLDVSSSTMALKVSFGTMGTEMANEPSLFTLKGPANRVPLAKKILILRPGLYVPANVPRVGVEEADERVRETPGGSRIEVDDRVAAGVSSAMAMSLGDKVGSSMVMLKIGTDKLLAMYTMRVEPTGWDRKRKK